MRCHRGAGGGKRRAERTYGVPRGVDLVPIRAAGEGVCVSGHTSELGEGVLVLDVRGEHAHGLPVDRLALMGVERPEASTLKCCRVPRTEDDGRGRLEGHRGRGRADGSIGYVERDLGGVVAVVIWNLRVVCLVEVECYRSSRRRAGMFSSSGVESADE